MTHIFSDSISIRKRRKIIPFGKTVTVLNMKAVSYFIFLVFCDFCKIESGGGGAIDNIVGGKMAEFIG